MKPKTVAEKILDMNAWIAVALMCLLSFAFMTMASRGDAAIMDELAHIPSGYSYVSHFDYRLNPEHPPLLKALATFPLLFLRLNFPAKSPAWTADTNGQWDMGTQFLYGSGNNPDAIIQWARIAPMLLTVLLIILIYAWAKELIGRFWALLPSFLFAFSPTVLAHGHYVTTDVAAAFGVVFGTYGFLKFLHAPSRRHLFYAGIAFGVAQLLKFSAVLLVPYFLALIFIYYLWSVFRDWRGTAGGERLKRFAIRGFRHFRSVLVIGVIGYALVVYPIYFLFTVNYPQPRQTSDTQSILASFGGGPTPAGHACKPVRCLADLDIWATKHAPTRPFAEYFLGILMVLQRSAGGNTNYFLGQVSAGGWHYYFPVMYFLKEPLPILMLVLLALILGIVGIVKKAKNHKLKAKSLFFDYLGTSFPEFSMIVFVALYWIWSIQSPLNIGFRHLLPTLPFIYILTASGIKKWAANMNVPASDSFLGTLFLWLKAAFTYSVKHLFIFALLLWFFAETLFAAPYFLSYFNELGGGVWGGYRYATDSNYDWGQDLLRLRDFVAAHPEIDKIAVDYFGGGNPKYYLGAKEENWWSARGNPSTGSSQFDSGQARQAPPIHWLAVSVNTLQGATEPTVAGQQRDQKDEYRWLTELRPPMPGFGNVPTPDYKAGTSIFIYKL